MLGRSSPKFVAHHQISDLRTCEQTHSNLMHGYYMGVGCVASVSIEPVEVFYLHVSWHVYRVCGQGHLDIVGILQFTIGKA